MTHALPLRQPRRLMMAVTFHSLLPLSQSQDEIAERHSDSGILFPLSPTEDRLLRFDADLAERFSLLHDELETANPVGADVLDRLTLIAVENLEHHNVAADDAPTGSAVSKTARLRTERTLRAIRELLNEVHTRLREDISLNAREVRSLFTARVEHSLGVTDPLVMELAGVEILETPEDTAAAKDAEQDLQADSPARTAPSGIENGVSELLLGISRAGRKPVVNKLPTGTQFNTDVSGASGDSQYLA